MHNIARIQERLNENNIDAVLLTSEVGRLYATGFKSSSGMLLITADNAWLVIDSRYFEAAQTAVKNAIVVSLPKNERFDDRIEALLSEAGVKTLGFEDGELTCRTFNKLSDRYCERLGVKMLPAQDMLNSLRAVKSREELELMIKAQRLAEKVFEEILPIISPDITEKDLAAEIIYRSHKNGADKESFDPIVVSGTNSSRPHGVPSFDKLQKGFLTIDFGICLDGWCTDTTRTLCIGRPSDEMVWVYETVLKAQEAGITAVHGGARGVDVDAAARSVIEAAGYGDYFGHGFGHSLGLEIHEPLSASPLSVDILPAGAVISAEPGIYLPGRFGVRIEDVLFVTDDGCENITRLPKELTVL